jgi:hypothetical protein
MGGDRVTVRNLKVLRVDAENNLLRGARAVPGARRLRGDPQGRRRQAGAAAAGKRSRKKGKK